MARSATETSTGAVSPEAGASDGPGDVGLVRIFGRPADVAPRAVPLPPRCTRVIGREPGEGGVMIARTSVSRAHARITRSHERIEVVDQGSKNGTFVNGERVTERLLAEGDELRFGEVVYKLVLHHVREVAAAGENGARLPHGMIGGLAMSRVVDAISAAARSGLNTLVTGETGTGKELVASALHAESGRRGRLCAVNCAAIPAALFESEIFGYKRGAFTGADRDAPGMLRAANGGTLFLDEIGDMPLEVQAKLLRVIETRQVVSVGSVYGDPVDVRIVAATHRDVRTLVGEGRFRGDLHARLEGFAIHLPPLRARKEDIEPLVEHFLREIGEARSATDAFMLALLAHDWPYNVRELATSVRHAGAVAEGAPVLDAVHLPEAVRSPRRAPRAASIPAPPLATVRPSPSKTRPTTAALIAALLQHRGNIAAMARTLGKDRSQVHRWLRDANIDPATYRG